MAVKTVLRLVSALGILALAIPLARAQLRPNLRVDGVRAPASAEPGARIRVGLNIEITGITATTAYAVFLGNGPFRTGAIRLGRFGPIAIGPDANRSFEVEVDLPSGLSGVRTLLVEVDPDRRLEESNEADNIAVSPNETLILPPSTALALRAVRMSTPPRRAPGASLRVEIDATNGGPMAAQVPVALVIGRDDVPTLTDRALGRVSLSIPAQAAQTVALEVPIPADLDAGTWRLGAVLDPDDALADLDPTNRTVSGPTVTVVRPELTLVTRSVPDGVLGVPYSVLLEARGGDGRYVFSVGSGLPDGLTLPAGSALLQGSPTRAGDFRFEVRVGSSQLTDAATVELRVQPTGLELSVGTSSLAIAFQRRPYAQPLIAGGGEPPYTWRLAQGELPAGLNLDASGLIEGVPEDVGVAMLQLTVSDRLGAERQVSYVLIVSLTPEVLIETSRVEAQVGVPLDASLQALGGLRPLEWRALTPPPPGLTLSRSGRLQGTPTRVGRWPFRVRATDATTPGVRDFAFIEVDIRDNGALRITSGPMAEAPRGALYEHVLTAQGGVVPYRWQLVPGEFLPGGFSLAPGPQRGAAENTGVIYGRAAVADLAAFTVRVEDAEGRRAEQALVYFSNELELSPQSGGCRALSATASSRIFWLGLLMLAFAYARRARLRAGGGVKHSRRARVDP